MVGACQQNSGIFLIRGGGPELEICEGRQRARSGQGPDEMPAGAEAGTGTKCRRPNHLAGSGLGAARDWDEIPAGTEAEQAGSKSTQKKALYNILQQFWIFQILLSCNDQIAVLQKSRIMVNLNFSSIIFIVFRITFLSKMLPKCYRPVWFQNLKIR